MALLHPSPACTIWWLYVLFSPHCKNLSDPMCRTKLRLSLFCFLLGMGTVFASQNCLLAGHLFEISLSLNGLHLRNTVTMSELHWPSVALLSEKVIAPHSSTLAWKIPRMEEPGRLQSMGLLGVGHDWATSLSPFTFMHWRRKWQPTPVFLPGESQGRGSLVGCRLWGHTESDTTEVT